MTNRTLCGVMLLIGCSLIAHVPVAAEDVKTLLPAKGVIVTSEVLGSDDTTRADQLHRGDVITKVGEIEISNVEEVSRVLTETKTDEKVCVTHMSDRLPISCGCSFQCRWRPVLIPL